MLPSKTEGSISLIKYPFRIGEEVLYQLREQHRYKSSNGVGLGIRIVVVIVTTGNNSLSNKSD